MPFDRNKPHAFVYGTGTGGAVFSQDGVLYGQDEQPIGGQPAPVEVAPVVAPAPAPVEETKTLLDLKAWALGEASYPFMSVRAAIKAQYDAVASDKNAALEILIEKGVVTESDLSK